MSTQIIKKEENLEKEAPTPLPEIKKVISSSKNHYNLKNFTPFTKKWRVKLYILNENGQWDDRGIGYVFCANEIEEKTNLNDGNKNNEQFAKKLIMLKEKTEEIIFNIDIRNENIDFHNQRGTILTWKNSETYGEDNNAISFQEKEGVIEILKNIKIVNGKTFSEEEILKNDPNDIYLKVTKENLPNLVGEIGTNMGEQKLSNFVEFLNETNFDFIKKIGKLLNDEEKNIEEQKSAVSFSSFDTNVTLNMKKNNKTENNKEITEKKNNNNMNKKLNNNSFSNENINYIFNIFKNLILIGDKNLLEILFNDECYLITFGALEYDFKLNKIVPHRKYFREIVKFKNPLNINDKNLLQKINQNLRLSYLRDTAFSRLIEDNSNRKINNIIQNNNNDIIQFFINHKEYIDILFSQLKSEDIFIKKDAILFLSELISCSKNVIESKITFNEVLCQNGILPILDKLIEDNPKNINSENIGNKNEINELININSIEIFISILTSVPLLIKKYLIENDNQMLQQLTNILLYHNNFGVKYEISQIFKTLIEDRGESYDKKLFFNSSIERFIGYLYNPYQDSSKPENKNDISSTIQIIIEIIMAWINHMGFDCQFWLEKFQINSVIINLLKEKNKIVNLYAIKLLKVILENSEHNICIKILSNDLCKLLTNILKENMKKNNIISSCLMNFFDSLSQKDIYILNIIMNYTSDFFYNNKDQFKNIILRYEKKSLPKKQLLSYLNINTITETSIKAIEPLFVTNNENLKENENEDNFEFYNDYINDINGEFVEDENDLFVDKNNSFLIENNIYTGNRAELLGRKRHLKKHIYDEEENNLFYNDFGYKNKKLNNYFNIHNNDKFMDKEQIGIDLREIRSTDDNEDDLYKNTDEDLYLI